MKVEVTTSPDAAARLQQLQVISAALASADSLEAITAAVVEQILPTIGAAGGVVALGDGDGHVDILRTHGYAEVGDAFTRISLDADLPIVAAAKGEAVWSSSAEATSDRFSAARDIPRVHEALVALPLRAGDVVVGALGLTFAEPRIFSDVDRAFLATVAQQCALAIERSRLAAAERGRRAIAEEEAEILEAEQRAGVLLVGDLELHAVLQAVTDAATEISGAEAGVFLFETLGPDGVRTPLVTRSGTGDPEVDRLATSLAVEVFDTGLANGGVARVDTLGSGLAAQITSRSGAPLGALLVTHPDRGAFSDRHERLVRGIAGHAGVAIDNALQYQEEHRARGEAEALAGRLSRLQALTAALGRAITPDDVVRTLIRDALPEADAPSRGLWLFDAGRGVLRLAADSEIAHPSRERFATVALDADVPVAEAARNRSVVFVGSRRERDERYPLLRHPDARGASFAVVPLSVDERVVGVLSVGYGRERQLDDAERRYLVAVAEQAALALDRARLYESERRARAAAEEDRRRAMELARVLQTSLLPPELPEVPGVELAARYHPALEGLEIGGDFYDVFDTGGDWAIVMGDVCGKGPEAAALTALARYTLRSVAAEVRQPAVALRRLNEVLYRHQNDERFCTVAYGRIVPAGNGVRVSVSCGGHLPPLIVRSSGEVEPIGPRGLIIGAFPDVRLWEETTMLHAGDLLVLYTDGVTEAANDGEQFGEQRLVELLEANAGASAATVAEAIERAVLDFSRPHLRDDVAILVLRVRDN